MSLTVEKCLQAWTNSLRQMNAKADIVFFGDSLTYYGDFSNVFPGKVVCNLGLRGDNLEGMIDRVEQVRILHPKMVFLMAGINDVALLDYSDFGDRYNTLLSKMQEVLPESRIVVQTLLPVNDRDFSISCNNEMIVRCNMSIQQAAARHKMAMIDLFSIYELEGYLPKYKTFDGIHLNEESYLAWIHILKSYDQSILLAE